MNSLLSSTFTRVCLLAGLAATAVPARAAAAPMSGVVREPRLLEVLARAGG
jgi:hypothetical protein